MNKDFHYEGTYAAAIIAGFRPEAAAKIAWAAQTVDECTKDNIKSFYPEVIRWNPVYTCADIGENIKEEISILSDEASETLMKVRGVWMPFHFLPGNTAGLIHYEGPSGSALSQRDIRDFLCMCDANSPMVLSMVERAALIFNGTDDIEKNNLLLMLGIVMHVLADTWAHRYFAGTPNALVNSADDIKILDGEPAGYDKSKTSINLTRCSMLNLGHGHVGHNPDYGCMTYSYHPGWGRTGFHLIKQGTDDFCSAFEQMEWVLRCIRGNRRFTMPEQHITIQKDWLRVVRDIVATREADQTAAWRHYMADFVDYSLLPPYSFSDKKHEMQYFQAYARDHRAFVLGSLQSVMNIMNI